VDAGCTEWTLDIKNNSSYGLWVQEYLGEELVRPELLFPYWTILRPVWSYKASWLGRVAGGGRKFVRLSGARPAVVIWGVVVASPDKQLWAFREAALRQHVRLKFMCPSD
jgi:hypothetical protein